MKELLEVMEISGIVRFSRAALRIFTFKWSDEFMSDNFNSVGKGLHSLISREVFPGVPTKECLFSSMFFD